MHKCEWVAIHIHTCTSGWVYIYTRAQVCVCVYSYTRAHITPCTHAQGSGITRSSDATTHTHLIPSPSPLIHASHNHHVVRSHTPRPALCPLTHPSSIILASMTLHRLITHPSSITSSTHTSIIHHISHSHIHLHLTVQSHIHHTYTAP